MSKLSKILKKGWNIKIDNQHRRCDVDSSGFELPHGRDHYGLYCWSAKKGDKTIKNEWPGFWKASSAINDMFEKIMQQD
jgi:hypothetical protein